MSIPWEGTEVNLDAILDEVLNTQEDFLQHKNESMAPKLPSFLTSSSASTNCSSTSSSTSSPSTSSPSASSPSASSASSSRCLVCVSRVSLGHFSYGGRSCESCRGFFRRTTLNTSSKMAKCVSGSNACLVDSRSRRSCVSCRYKRCLEAGMRPRLVTKSFNKVPHVLSLPFTLEEQLKLSKLSVLVLTSRLEVVGSSLERQPQIGLDFFEATINGSVRASLRFVQVLERNERAVVERWSSHLEELRSLSSLDVSSLVQHNFPLMFGLLNAVLSLDATLFTAHLEGIREEVSRRRHLSPTLQLLSRLFNLLDAEHRRRLSLLWYGVDPIDEEHRAEMLKVITCLRTNEEDEAIDVSLQLLVCLVLLFSTQGREDKSVVKLINAQAVEKAQNHFVLMLHRYLRMQCGIRAGSKTIDAIGMANVACSLYNRHCQLVQNMVNKVNEDFEDKSNNINFFKNGQSLSD